MWVLDASVVASPFMKEPDSRAARTALLHVESAGGPVRAPDLLLLEVASAFAKRVGRGELGAASAQEALGEVEGSAIELVPSAVIVRQALGLSIAHGLTPYDGAYVAVALNGGGRVVTLDRRLVATARTTGLPVVDAASLGEP